MPLSQSQQQHLRNTFGEDAIVYFGGQNEFLSSFFRSPFVLDGVTYKSGEHAFQAQKFTDPASRASIVKAATAGAAKKQARKLARGGSVTPGWFSGARDEAMRKALAAKFAPGSALASRLLATGSCSLVEGNSWDDTYWGVTLDGVGQNKLGALLHERRDALAALAAAAGPPDAPPAAVRKPEDGAEEPAAPSAKRRKVKAEADVIVVE